MTSPAHVVVLTVRMRARNQEAALARAERIAAKLRERVSVEHVDVELEDSEFIADVRDDFDE